MSAEHDNSEFLFEDFPPDPPKKKAPARTVNADAGCRNQSTEETTSQEALPQVERQQLDQNSPNILGGAKRENHAEILKRLEVDAVLLPIKRGTKRPNRKGWQKLSFTDTQDSKFQQDLTKSPAIGVLLGSASGGLCSIDFDDDEFLETFVDMNPKLKDTLKTTAKRGANLWIVLECAPPPSRKLVFEGTAVGEFRSDGSQTLIAGLHPEGFTYQRLVDAPPVRLRYSEIHWPLGTEGPPPHPSYSSQSSEPSPDLHHLHNLHNLHDFRDLHNIGQKIQASEAAREKLKSDPKLERLYQKFIEKKIIVRAGMRNSGLIAMTTFLFGAVGKGRLMELVSAFHQMNQDVFNDPLEQHMKEANAHYAACERKWLESLSDSERKGTTGLPEVYVAAFRICRELAAYKDDSMPTSHFFLSCDDLAARLGLLSMEAQRIIRAFEAAEWLEIVQIGTRHTKGQRGRATRYRWILGAAQVGKSPPSSFKSQSTES